METKIQRGEIPSVQPFVYTAIVELNDLRSRLQGFSETDEGKILGESFDKVRDNMDHVISELGEVIGNYALEGVINR